VLLPHPPTPHMCGVGVGGGRWDIRPEFVILVNARHKKVLEVIKGYFGVGTIFHSSCARYARAMVNILEE
jgi:hypothetical protein